jgi:excinuclease ABC subunit C
MKEVLTRRFTPKDNQVECIYPDLLIIDGGKGQLSHAMEVLDGLGLRGKFVVIGLAKRLEEIFTTGSSLPLFIAKTSSSLRLLQQARDEAHRFAVRYHRKLREKRTLHTELEDVPGVGAVSAEKLLRSFGSVEAVRLASGEDLRDVVGPAVANRVRRYFDIQADDADAES